MVDIRTKKGLDIPIRGAPKDQKIIDLPIPHVVALDLQPFSNIRFNFLVKPGSKVKIGDPIAQDKGQEDVYFVSPGNGIIKEIIRGEKRRPLKVVIAIEGEEYKEFSPPDLKDVSKENLLKFLSISGFLPHIKKRPCDTIPKPTQIPEAIFVRAVDKTPFNPNPELQILGFEQEFNKGLEVLSKLTNQTHLIHSVDCQSSEIRQAKIIKTHSVKGPYPCCSSSLHLYHVYPLMDPGQVAWVLQLFDVVVLGSLFLHGKYFVKKVISRCGEVLPEKERQHLRAYQGTCLGDLFSKDMEYNDIRILSGNPLTGNQQSLEGFLGFFDYSVSLLKENIKREPLHFFALGFNKYTATKGYLSGFFQKRIKGYHFSTNQHGEERAFVDSDVYQDVMPMRIPVMDLIKAILTEDFDKAVEYGLLEVSADDFILPTFICPSKIEMYQIVKEGLYKYAEQYLDQT